MDQEFQALVDQSVESSSGRWRIEHAYVFRAPDLAKPRLRLSIRSGDGARREIELAFYLESHVAGGNDPSWALDALAHELEGQEPGRHGA